MGKIKIFFIILALIVVTIFTITVFSESWGGTQSTIGSDCTLGEQKCVNFVGGDLVALVPFTCTVDGFVRDEIDTWVGKCGIECVDDVDDTFCRGGDEVFCDEAGHFAIIGPSVMCGTECIDDNDCGSGFICDSENSCIAVEGGTSRTLAIIIGTAVIVVLAIIIFFVVRKRRK